MASSVSSERIFSSAGITITKRRNRLKADIAEALQVMKCAIRNDMVTREHGPQLEDMDWGDREHGDGEIEGTAEQADRKPKWVIDLTDDEDEEMEEGEGVESDDDGQGVGGWNSLDVSTDW